MGDFYIFYTAFLYFYHFLIFLSIFYHILCTPDLYTIYISLSTQCDRLTSRPLAEVIEFDLVWLLRDCAHTDNSCSCLSLGYITSFVKFCSSISRLVQSGLGLLPINVEKSTFIISTTRPYSVYAKCFNLNVIQYIRSTPQQPFGVDQLQPVYTK